MNPTDTKQSTWYPLSITEIASPKPGNRRFKVDSSTLAANGGATQRHYVEAYLRHAHKRLNAAVDVEQEPNGCQLTVDSSLWRPDGNYELYCEYRDEEDQLVGCGRQLLVHTPTSLAQPTYPGGSTPPGATSDAAQRVELAGDLTRPGAAITLKVLAGACDEVDLHDVTCTVVLEDHERCCQEIPVTVKSVQGVTSQRFVLPLSFGVPATLHVTARRSGGAAIKDISLPIEERKTPPSPERGPLDGESGPPVVEPRSSVSLRRAARAATPNQDFYTLIRLSTNAMSFDSYQAFLEVVFCGESGGPRADELRATVGTLGRSRLRLPFPGVDAYRTLKAATEVFILLNSGAITQSMGSPIGFIVPNAPTLAEEESRMGRPLVGTFQDRLNAYLTTTTEGVRTLPYLELIRRRLTGIDVVQTRGPGQFDCEGIVESKLTSPLLIELIHSYWLEQGGLAQTMLAIGQRFQNRHAGGERDALAQLEISALQPVSSVLWGWAQDEQHRLSVVRRAHEYLHQYGMQLQGKAVRDVRPAENRSKFLEAFHNLLHQAMQFFWKDDDTTKVADGFGVLNTLKETHYVLAQSASNQFGEMPATSRGEMLIEQWILATPEVGAFLAGRAAVPYPERWMDRVDTVKTLKGWTDVPVVHFRDLAVFGEQLLLSVRYDAWSTRNDPDLAANWARYWRPEIQGYIHAYRAATGIDLSVELTDQAQLSERFLSPSVHLSRRLASQARSRA